MCINKCMNFKEWLTILEAIDLETAPSEAIHIHKTHDGDGGTQYIATFQINKGSERVGFKVAAELLEDEKIRKRDQNGKIYSIPLKGVLSIVFGPDKGYGDPSYDVSNIWGSHAKYIYTNVMVAVNKIIDSVTETDVDGFVFTAYDQRTEPIYHRIYLTQLKPRGFIKVADDMYAKKEALENGLKKFPLDVQKFIKDDVESAERKTAHRLDAVRKEKIEFRQKTVQAENLKRLIGKVVLYKNNPKFDGTVSSGLLWSVDMLQHYALIKNKKLPSSYDDASSWYGSIRVPVMDVIGLN